VNGAWADEALLRSVTSLWTAPFREHAVIAFLRCFAAKYGLAFSQDVHGNVLLRYESPSGRALPWVLTAHMDHPGFVALRREGKTLWAQFRGGVDPEYFPGSLAVFDCGKTEAGAVCQEASPLGRCGWQRIVLELDEAARIPRRAVGMWDVPTSRVKEGRLQSRACDDLAGLAAILQALRELKQRQADYGMAALFTRAEEVGFVGAIGACHSGILPEDAWLVTVETSLAQPEAPLGGGVVLRVGDKARVFDASLTSLLDDAAGALSERDRDFAYMRRLMPGGTCEATAFGLLGYRAAALCLPLENYHNRQPGTGIAAEEISLSDYGNLVKLFLALAEVRVRPEDIDETRRELHRQRFEDLQDYLVED
jgi:endoglucanase